MNKNNPYGYKIGYRENGSLFFNRLFIVLYDGFRFRSRMGLRRLSNGFGRERGALYRIPRIGQYRFGYRAFV